MKSPANPANSPDPTARRGALRRLFALAAAPAATLPALTACGGGGSAPIVVTLPPPPVPTPPPSPPAPTPAPVTAPLARLQAALAGAAPTPGTAAVTITQGTSQSASSSFGPSAQWFPPLPQDSTHNLTTVSQLYGFRRDLWSQFSSGVIAGQAVVPVTRSHQAATLASAGRIGLHFNHTGQAFEVLVGGATNAVTLVVDGQYAGTTQLAAQNVPAGTVPLPTVDALLKFDFGTSAARRISLYLLGSLGPCALVVAPGDTVQPWDRSAEASFAAMSDSYGGAYESTWGMGGLFYEAAAQLGIPNVDLDAIGGTGYAPNSTNTDTLNAGNAFPQRLANIVDDAPDLFVVAGSLNDNNRLALPPYSTAAAAQAGFAAAVTAFFTELRASLPQSVIAAIGPWQPPANLPTPAGELAKAAIIQNALAAVAGPWVFVDNINGGWINSSGNRSAPSSADGPWQTTSNAAQYLGSDNIHPNANGCAYLGGRLATALRAGILAL